MAAKKPSLVVACMALGFLASCETSASKSAAVAPPVPPLAPGEELLGRIETLPPQTLADGECGLFLWTRVGNDRLLAVFQRSTDSAILMQLKGKTVRLERDQADGRSFLGIQEHQIVKNLDVTAELTFSGDSVEAIAQGLQVKRASLRLTDRDGWDVAMPVAGLIACQRTTS